MRQWFALALTTASLCYGAVAIAQDDTQAMQWLRRVYSATEHLSYTGTFVYQHGDQVETSVITRLVDSHGVRERVDTLDGPPREVVRDNEEVKCDLPGAAKVRIDNQRDTRPFSAMRIDRLKDVTEQYRVRKGGIARIAGHDCQELILEPKDNLRYGHRLWADVNTGVLVKAKTFNDKNKIIEQFYFTQLQIGGKIDPSLVKSRYAESARHWRVEQAGIANADLGKMGWSLKALPPGYKKVAELQRDMGASRSVGHIVVSDGLAAVSIFIEAVGGKKSQAPMGLSHQGMLYIYTRMIDDHLITAVGEVPPGSVRDIADAVEYRPLN
jgi:sigma-E factor negative regulatory protein RseB